MTKATAVHCMPMVGALWEIMPIKIAIQIVRPIALYIMIFRRPNRSMVKGRKTVPRAKRVFMTAARSCDKNGVSPTWEKITVL